MSAEREERAEKAPEAKGAESKHDLASQLWDELKAGAVAIKDLVSPSHSIIDDKGILTITPCFPDDSGKLGKGGDVRDSGFTPSKVHGERDIDPGFNPSKGHERPDIDPGFSPGKRAEAALEPAKAPGEEFQRVLMKSPGDSDALAAAQARRDLADGEIGKAAGEHGGGDSKAKTYSASEASVEDAKIHASLPELIKESVNGATENVLNIIEDVKAQERLRDNPAVKAEHEKLEKIAEKKISDPEERKQFVENMQKFEQRAAAHENEYQKQFESQGMKPDEAAKAAADKVHKEVTDSYKNVERLMGDNPKAPVSEKDRVYLAEQSMQHAADPHSISQGYHDTCNATVIETRTFTSDPANATKLIADMATTGKYTTNGHPPVTVTLDKESLQKHDESSELPPSKRKDGDRDYASQLFEVTAVNILLQKENAKTTPHGQIRYEQHEPIPGKSPQDTGERMLDYSKHPPAPVLDKEGKPDNSPPISSVGQINEISQQISPEPRGGKMHGVTGIDDDGLVRADNAIVGLRLQLIGIGKGEPLDLSDPKAIEKAREELAKKTDVKADDRQETIKALNELERDLKIRNGDGQAHVHSADELKDTILKAKAEGKLPIVVQVFTGNEPLWTDSDAGFAGGAGGKHVVTITDYDPVTGQLKLENQWDSKSSHDISPEQLYRAMRTPSENIDVLQQEVSANRARGPEQIDYSKELELLRLKHNEGKVSDQEFDKELTGLAVENYKRHMARGEKSDNPDWVRSKNIGAGMLGLIEGENQARADKIRDDVTKAMKA